MTLETKSWSVNKMKTNMLQDDTLYDKMQIEVKNINETLKNFKIKNRNQFVKLAQEEEVLTRELELLNEKFDSILTTEKVDDRSTIPRSISSAQSVASSGTKQRPASVTSKRTNQTITSKVTSKV